MTKLHVRLAKAWLLFVYRTSDRRIQGGDLDFEDVYYRSRDASGVLLDVWYSGARP